MARITTIGRFDHSEAETKHEIILGIDLGTTNSLVAISENGKPRVLKDENGKTLVPSAIYWGEGSSTPLVGSEARRLRITDAAHTAYSVKRFMGRGKSDIDTKNLSAIDTSLSTDQNIMIKLGDKSFSAIELSAEILKHLKNLAEKNLNQKVTKAVVTVPAYFNDSQRSATRTAGQLAGLDIIRIVNEPTAAALAYGINKKQNELIAVYDLGGGTFDISILKLHDGIFEVLSTNGDTALGGDDFDSAIADIIAKQIPNLPDDLQTKANVLEAAESIKKKLSENDIATTDFQCEGKKHQIKITRSDFSKAIEPLIQKTISITEKALSDAKLNKSEIGEIVLVGGSTRIPLVRETLKKFFNKDLNLSVDPDEVVALGAAVQADILSGRNQDLVLLDIVPLSLGIETYGGTFGKIIHRNSKIPSVAKETFTTHVDGQRNVLIHVLQGERELATDCRSLGKFNLKGLPPMPAGLPKIEVIFLVDANGILTVKAKELTTQTEAHIEVKPTYGLDDAQVEKMLNASFEFAESDMKSRQLIDTRVEAEGILRSAEKILNEGKARNIDTGINEVTQQMTSVREKIKGDDHIAIKTALEALEEAAKPLAAEVMNQALQSKLNDKKINEVLQTKKD